MKLVLIDCQDVQRVGSSSTYRLGTNIASGSDYDIGDGLEINIDKAVTGKVIWLSVYAGTTFNNLTFYPMLVKGTEAKIYEKYGATPSLKIPSKIKTVKDNVNEAVCNKNLQKNKWENKTSDGASSNYRSTINIDDMNLKLNKKY